MKSRVLSLKPNPVLALLAGLLVFSGCLPSAPSVELPAVSGDLYWVECDGAKIAYYRMPQFRGDDGAWYEFDSAPPSWYTRPALYEFTEAGQWVQYSSGLDESLDEWLVLWDVRPATGPN